MSQLDPPIALAKEDNGPKLEYLRENFFSQPQYQSTTDFPEVHNVCVTIITCVYCGIINSNFMITVIHCGKTRVYRNVSDVPTNINSSIVQDSELSLMYMYTVCVHYCVYVSITVH